MCSVMVLTPVAVILVGTLANWWYAVGLLLTVILLAVLGAFRPLHRWEVAWANKGKEERERIAEGSRRVAAAADAVYRRTGRTPTSEEMRVEMESRASGRLAAERMAALEARGVPEDVIFQGESAMAQIETALSFMSPDDRSRYLESMSPETRPLGEMALASVEADEMEGHRERPLLSDREDQDLSA